MGNQVNDEAFNELGGLTKLKALNLKATTLTDESIDTLMKLQNLEDLTVAGTQLSDDSFRKLGTLPKLKKTERCEYQHRIRCHR